MSYKLVKETPTYRFYSWGGGQTKARRYPVIGGDYNGQRLTSIDLHNAGIHSEYVTFNRAGWRCKGHGSPPTQVHVHLSLLEPEE